jgi:hypothetical protein
VNGLDVALPAGHVKVGADAAFNVTVKAAAPPGRHVIRVEVWNPAGELVKKYGYDFEAPRGTGQGDVYLALNDPLGEWRLRCTDVATGVAAEAKFTVGK